MTMSVFASESPLHDRKQTTVLFCIAVCDTYAVGEDHTNLFYILLNLFYFKFKKINVTLAESL
jgi:hypothetical protein